MFVFPNYWFPLFENTIVVFKFQVVGFNLQWFSLVFNLFDLYFSTFRISVFRFPNFWFSILRLSHPRLRSFSIAARRFESRWVHSVLACFTWFCSASCRVDFNYVVLLCSLFEFQFWKHALVFQFSLFIFNCPFHFLGFRFLFLILIFRFRFSFFDF